MAGREGLIDTAVKARLGISRGSLSRHWRTARSPTIALCRNAGGSIVQFLFGEDGMDACSIEQQFFPTMPIDSYSAIAVEYLLTSGDLDSSRRTHDRKALQILTKQLSGDTAKRLGSLRHPHRDKQRLVDSKACKDSRRIHIAIAYDRILACCF
jgi:hypothetical protein